MNKKKLTIIGGDSFIGKNLISKLCNKYSVLNLSRQNKFDDIQFHEFNFNGSAFNIKKILESDFIIYCIGAGIQPGHKDSEKLMLSLNTTLPIDISIFLSQNNFSGKFITFGSYFEIGINDECKLYNEIDLIFSNNEVPNFYCCTKRLLTRFAHDNFLDLNHIHLILPNVYGPSENKNRLIPYLIDKIKRNEKVHLTDGNQVRQFFHISDLIKLIDTLLVTDSIKRGVLNVAPEHEITVREIFNSVLESMKTKNFNKISFGTKNRYDNSMRFLKLDNFKLRNYIKLEFDISKGIKSYL